MKIILTIIFIICLGYFYSINENNTILTTNKCINTENTEEIYNCLYKKNLFTIENFSIFLEKNQNKRFYDKNKNIDLLIESILFDEKCKKEHICSFKLDEKKYDQLLNCSEDNEYCSNILFLNSNHFKNNICTKNENLFLNKIVYNKYVMLNKSEQEQICKFAIKKKFSHYEINTNPDTLNTNKKLW